MSGGFESADWPICVRLCLEAAKGIAFVSLLPDHGTLLFSRTWLTVLVCCVTRCTRSAWCTATLRCAICCWTRRNTVSACPSSPHSAKAPTRFLLSHVFGRFAVRVADFGMSRVVESGDGGHTQHAEIPFAETAPEGAIHKVDQPNADLSCWCSLWLLVLLQRWAGTTRSRATCSRSACCCGRCGVSLALAFLLVRCPAL